MPEESFTFRLHPNPRFATIRGVYGKVYFFEHFLQLHLHIMHQANVIFQLYLGAYRKIEGNSANLARRCLGQHQCQSSTMFNK